MTDYTRFLSSTGRQLAESALGGAPENVLLLSVAAHARMACGDDAGAVTGYVLALARAPLQVGLAGGQEG